MNRICVYVRCVCVDEEFHTLFRVGQILPKGLKKKKKNLMLKISSCVTFSQDQKKKFSTY